MQEQKNLLNNHSFLKDNCRAQASDVQAAGSLVKKVGHVWISILKVEIIDSKAVPLNLTLRCVSV